MTDKTYSHSLSLDREQFLKQERQVLLVWGLMVIIAFPLLIGMFLFIWEGKLLAQVIDFPNLSRAHSVSITYDTADLPPAGGNHKSTWQNCGIYKEAPDPARIVHSLEHGAIWLAYRPTLPAEQVAALEEMVSNQAEIIMSPYPELENDAVITAWGKQLVIESIPNKRITAFIKRYRGKGPESNDACSGGVGTPVH